MSTAAPAGGATTGGRMLASAGDAIPTSLRSHPAAAEYELGSILLFVNRAIVREGVKYTGAQS